MGYELLLNFSRLYDIPSDRYLHHWLKNFDLNFYRNFPHYQGKSDLLHLSDEDLITHFIHRGKLEGRPYNKFFYSFIDSVFYKSRYPEFGDGPESGINAIRHWMYYGVFERRIPNVVVQRLVDAKFHLYQMGKVGSKSIQKAIAEAGHHLEIPHLHFANDFLFSYPDCFYSYDEIINLPRRDSIFFISGVREPIGRLLSGLLQSSDEDFSSQTENKIEELIGNTNQFTDYLNTELNNIENWFDHNYFCNINVFEKPFDTEKGWSVFDGDMHRLFLYRQDKLDNCWDGLSEYTGLNLVPKKINVTSIKEDRNELHKRLFMSKFDKKFVDKVYSTKYSKHFFSPVEIDHLIRHWSVH